MAANGAGMLLERRSSVRRSHSLVLESERGSAAAADEALQFRSQGANDSGWPLKNQVIGSVFDRSPDAGAPKSRLAKEGGEHPSLSEMDMMKERFAKLLLGEDMSGSGKGVSSALAVSNAITNLAASVFGEQRRLEPMAPERKARWRKEINWLLSVADHIVEFVPKKQVLENGTEMEVMATQQRRDLQANIPALRKIDTMLIEYLDNFKDRNEFWYVKRDASESEKQRKDDKWWLPTVRVPANGLSPTSRSWLQYQKELVNQVLKAAMAINANVLMEMEIPEAYIESLPKNGRASLGDQLYRIITDVEFDPDIFLSSVELSTEHKILDLKDRIEASVIIWNRKVHHKEVKSPWGSAVSQEKREQFEERAQTLLLILKHRFPGIPQSTLDITKIQDNRDVGYAVLESYSRVLESLAFTVMSRIEDVLSADNLVKEQAKKDAQASQPSSRQPSPTTAAAAADQPVFDRDPTEDAGSAEGRTEGSPTSMTLLDFMGWSSDRGEADAKEEEADAKEEKEEEAAAGQDEGRLMKLPNIVTTIKNTYMDKLEFLGGHKSPTSRH